MACIFNLGCFHKVSTISFSGNFPWEDLVVLKRTVVVALPLSLDLPLSNTLDGPALRNIPGHYQRVMYRWMSAWSGLNLVSFSLFQFLVQFSSCWAMFISSFSFPLVFTHCLLVSFFYKGTSGRFSLSSSLPLGSFSCTSFSATLFDHLPLPVLDFLVSGASLSNSSFSCVSFFLDLLCSLPASLSYCHPPC